MTLAVVSGALGNKPFNGGAAWTRLSYVLGLREMGLDVHFVEQIAPEDCVDARGRTASFEESVNLAYFRAVVASLGLDGSATLVCTEGPRTEGLAPARLEELAAATDLLVNVSGHLTLPSILRGAARRVYIDADPGYTQFWHAAGRAGSRLEGHDVYFTVGENVGRAGCPIPTDGIRWRPTRPPAVLAHWPAVDPPHTGAAGRGFTTVGSWRGPYGPVTAGGRTFGLKVHEFRRFIDLPRRVARDFEIALDIYPADGRDLERLRSHGWRIVDPRRVVPDPLAFRGYVQASDAEFSVAQGIYVETRSGWFSDRTVRYLASGRPTLVQDTGFSRNHPVGDGLVAFRTLEEAAAGARRILADYENHCRAARALAEERFEAGRVLGRLLDEAGVAT